jgi:hypothetical protein
MSVSQAVSQPLRPGFELPLVELLAAADEREETN